MSCTVGQLIEIEHLGLSVEAGGSGTAREITWAHVCELADPRPWLEGGELIMTTGLAVPRQATAQVAYLDRLLEAGAAALGVAEAMSAPPVTAAMRRHADEVGFPVLRVSYEVPFIAISQVVLAANHKSLERRMLKTLTIFDSLRRGTTVLGSTAEVLARLEVLSGYSLGIASAERTLIAGEPTLLSVLPELPRGPVERPVVEAHVVDDRRRYVLPLSIAGRFSGFLLAEEREPGSGLGTLALQNVATVAAVQLAAIRRSRDVHFAIAREALEDVLSGVPGEAAVRRRVELAGVDPDAPLVLVVLDGIAETLERELYGHLCDRGLLTLVRRDATVVWLAMTQSDYEEVGAGDGLAALLSQPSHVGASRPIADLSDARAAACEARWALAEACRRQLRAVDAGGDPDPDPGTALAWLPRDRFLLERIVEQTLGRLVEGDRGGTSLLATLRAFLEEGQRIDATCRRVGVHRHTLAYRLRRVEELTGRSLHRTDDVVELWRAVRAQEVLDPLGATGPAATPPETHRSH
jgi:purine catabolism regulator